MIQFASKKNCPIKSKIPSRCMQLNESETVRWYYANCRVKPDTPRCCFVVEAFFFWFAFSVIFIQRTAFTTSNQSCII